MSFKLIKRQKYVRTSREVMRIEGTLRSPVNTCITDANAGRVTINAYEIERYMLDNYNKHQNKNGTAWVLIKESSILNRANLYQACNEIWPSVDTMGALFSTV